MPDKSAPEVKENNQATLMTRLRNYFLTGLLVTAPPALTIYLAVLFVSFIDNKVRHLIPEEYNPEQYLPFAIPGLGVVIVIVALIVLGAFTTGYLGRLFVRIWERMWEKMPFVSGIYSTFKQLFETVFSKKSNAFRQVVLVEFPRKDVWTVAFVTSDVPYALSNALNDNELISVYVPTTPNPTSGYWGMYRRQEVIPLDISVEDGLKMVISLGIVSKKKN
ncbi:MAG: DUF502 domain-containing protein [Alphaproteobacteria bacterium]|nr:DUF502 domain-containing protein [Alphaproteobacteria bacterium]